jgi:cardiolipin synthase
MLGVSLRPLRINLATKLTLLRIVCVPLLAILVFYGRHGWVLVVFAFSALTDAADGIIARTFGQKTWLGSFLDPIADKLLLVTAFISMSFLVHDPTETTGVIVVRAWITIVVIFRDIVILLGAGILQILIKDLEYRPTLLSKMTTVCQTVTILEVASANFLITTGRAALKQFVFPTSILSHITLAMTILSGLHYILVGTKILTHYNETRQAAG